MDIGPKPASSATDANAILGKGAEFEGKLAFEGTVRIDGKFSGEINSAGTLVIGEGARVAAEIAVGTLIVHGDVVGNVRASELVDLQGSGRLRGNIRSTGLSVHQGAIFDGNCSMSGTEA